MDRRDPTALGEALLALKAGCNIKLSEIADGGHPSLDCRSYDADNSIGRETHRRYHDELQERARAGDRYAKSMLLGHAYQEPADAS